MTLPTFTELFEKLSTSDESVEIEAKKASDLTKRALETVSAFSNEPDRGGGYLLLGVEGKEGNLFRDFDVVGVENPDKLQADLATQCRDSFNTPIRPEIQVERHEGKTVLVVFVPEAPAHDKPVYLRSRGVPKGAFRRIGSTTQTCTDDDIAMFYEARGHRSYDETAVQGTTVADVDPAALEAYRRTRRERGAEAALLDLPDPQLLRALGATAEQGEALTVAGLVLFGNVAALRRYLPMTRIDYIRVDGREWVSDPDHRYQTVEKLGPLVLTVPTIVGLVLDDIPKSFSLAEDGVHRQDVPLIPRKVIREAVVNAVMHRSYRSHQPVQIIRYSNRLEIKNPGYSLIPSERLGEPGSRTRNPRIAAALHDLGLAETKGTGIPTMRKVMSEANLTDPLFESDHVRSEFAVRLLTHHLLSEDDWAWLGRFKAHNLSDDEARALVVLRELGALDNAAYRSINRVDTLTASSRLRRLRDIGLLDQRGQGRSTYYLPTPALLGSSEAGASPNPLDSGLSRGSDPLDTEELPRELAAAIEGLGKRARPEKVKQVITRLCAWQPLSGAQLGKILDRNPTYLSNNYLRQMLGAGELELLYPDSPAHPKQAYKAPAKGK